MVAYNAYAEECRAWGAERESKVGAVMTLTALLLIALALLQALYAYTTWRILSAGGRELNPAMRYAIAQAGVIPALVAKGAVVVALAWYFCLPYPRILGALVLFYACAVLFNFRSIK